MKRARPCTPVFVLAALVGLAVVTGPACGGDSGPQRRYEAAQSVSAYVLVDQYDLLIAQTVALKEPVDALCGAGTNPTVAALLEAREAWWAARGPWQYAEVMAFGPLVAYPERFGPKLDTWPTDAAGLAALVTGDEALDAASFRARGARLRGFAAVEHLLWQPPPPLSWGEQAATSDAVVAALEAEPRRCEALVGLSTDLAELAAGLAEAWETGWAATDAPRDVMHDMPQEMLDEWVDRMVFTVENIRAEKLGKPAGDSTGGSPQPDAIESRPSGRSLEDARDALRGVRDVWTGRDGTHLGIAHAVDPRALLGQVDAAFDDAEQALAAVPETLESAVAAHADAIVTAQDALRGLQLLLQVEVAQALGVTITFNDNDGD